jgi:hypothetical protein
MIRVDCVIKAQWPDFSMVLYGHTYSTFLAIKFSLVKLTQMFISSGSNILVAYNSIQIEISFNGKPSVVEYSHLLKKHNSASVLCYVCAAQ